MEGNDLSFKEKFNLVFPFFTIITFNVFFIWGGLVHPKSKDILYIHLYSAWKIPEIESVLFLLILYSIVIQCISWSLIRRWFGHGYLEWAVLKVPLLTLAAIFISLVFYFKETDHIFDFIQGTFLFGAIQVLPFIALPFLVQKLFNKNNFIGMESLAKTAFLGLVLGIFYCWVLSLFKLRF